MKTYHGSCHCGAVRYEADIDIAAGTIKCNCSVCTKMRFWAAVIPPSQFRLVKGGDALGEYRFHTKHDGHYFCRYCGINVWSTGDAPRTGAFYAVTVGSLDDMPVEALIGAPVRYIDGRNDNWVTPPDEVRHL